jgi:hypothetical protein
MMHLAPPLHGPYRPPARPRASVLPLRPVVTSVLLSALGLVAATLWAALS